MPDPEKNIFSRYTLLLIGLLSLCLSFSWGPLFFSKSDQNAEGKRIFRVFEAKEKLIREGMKRIVSGLSAAKSDKEGWSLIKREETGNSGVFFTISRHDTIAFWSSSLVAFDRKAELIKPEGMLKKMPTGWFYLFSEPADNYTVYGYMLIKRDFPYQNRYVQSTFQEDFNLADQCEVLSEQVPGTIQVFCKEGKFHFGIQFHGMQSRSPLEEIPELFFFFLFILLLSWQVWRWIDGWKYKPWIKLFFTLGFAILFYLSLNFLRLPREVYAGKLFEPGHFAWSRQLSSMGDYLLLSWFLFYVAQSFFLFFRRDRKVGFPSLKGFYLSLFAASYFVFSILLYLILLDNSDVSMELYSNLSISISNFLASGCVSLQMLGLGVILIRIRCLVAENSSHHFQLMTTLGSLAIPVLTLLLAGLTVPLAAIVVYLVISLLLGYSGADLISKYKLSFLLLFGLLIAFGLNILARKELDTRKSREQKITAINLATERDPAAEIFLSDFESKVMKDTVIRHYLSPPFRNLGSYMKESYFTGFWKNYEFQITVCAEHDSVLLTDEKRKFPCQDFFNQLKESKGVRLPGSDFYFMDRLNGRISYLGELHLLEPKEKRPLMVFVELNSMIIPEGKGYPQLLMDQQGVKRSREAGFSYAKYFGNKLVDRGGTFLYDPFLQEGIQSADEFSYFEKDGFSHCVYRRSADNLVIVSYPLLTWVDKGRGFTPLFLLIYFLGLGWIVLSQRGRLISKNRFELRGKIQVTLVSTLLVSLFLIGLGLVAYNFNEFQRNMQENLNQKVRAVSSELGLRVGTSAKLDSIQEYLGDQLAEISDMAWTDINIYDLKGRLVASSRNEIFEKGLTSERMNPQAFWSLNYEGRAAFLHNENLGKMEFFSVYAPLFNRSDELTGYVNLPYFNRQDEFTRQVSGFIVAFINLYILLVLLIMLMALLISTKLTVPLLQIEQKLKGIALGKQNARIEYKGEDEIGRLVEAYNKKVSELEESAGLLARSERETAWKEMARQIAHEINNPLTPMKLNIQYLQKIRDEGGPGFDEYFNRVTKMLVSQIDTLSSIASAFSNFAMMPSQKIEQVEMSGLLKEVTTLFDSPDEYAMELILPDGQYFVSGDRDQLRRALVNIIRNAAQALQNQTGGKIIVGLILADHKLSISVADNGSGIAAADQERLFQPNFTTKSGGMGLGLAITKSILENYNGEIGFESQPGKTNFYLSLPLSEPYDEVNSPSRQGT